MNSKKKKTQGAVEKWNKQKMSLRHDRPIPDASDSNWVTTGLGHGPVTSAGVFSSSTRALNEIAGLEPKK